MSKDFGGSKNDRLNEGSVSIDVDHKYANVTNLVDQSFGIQNLHELPLYAEIFGYLSFADLVATTYNQFASDAINFPEYGGIMEIGERPFWDYLGITGPADNANPVAEFFKILVDARKVKCSNPQIVYDDMGNPEKYKGYDGKAHVRLAEVPFASVPRELLKETFGQQINNIN